MIQLLYLKERFFDFVARFEIYVFAAVRFVIAFAAFRLINGSTGYMTDLEEYPIALVLALLCSFLPSGAMLFFGAALILLQFYALSEVLCLITAMIFVLLFGIYLRFSTRKGIYTVLTPLLSVLGIPYAMPVASGLLEAPYTVVSVLCGEATYFLMKHVIGSSALFASGSDTSTKSILTLAASEILTDKEMYLYLIVFAVSAIVVYGIRKLSVDWAHPVAVVVGVVVELALITGGEVYIGNSKAVPKVIIGCIVSLIIMLIIALMTYSLDYSRVERLQFEDDEYYYYVKAVPKAIVQRQEKQVKHIHRKKTRDAKRHRKGKEEAAAPVSGASLEEQVLREFLKDNQ